MANEAEKVSYERVTADQVVCPTPCLLYMAHLAGGSGGASTAVIRDGHSTSADAVIDLAAPASGMDFVSFDPPILLKKGLYVDVGSNVTSVLVQYLSV